MRGLWIKIAIAGGLLVIAFVVAVGVLNQTVYTASGFVRGYLDALARHDVRAALSLAGPLPSSSANDDLLVAEVLGELERFELTAAQSGDVHTVTVDYRADGRDGRTAFRVEQTGSVLGIFPTWGFASTPLAQLELTIKHARDFTANGVRFVAPVQDVPSSYLAFTPGVITFAHRSEFLSAPERSIVLGMPRSQRSVAIDARANPEFERVVAQQVALYLDECVAQERLFPIGCPFGQVINDRLDSAPDWSIVAYPTIAVEPTAVPGEWHVPAVAGRVRLDVAVRSIADGEVTPFETEMDFAMNFTATFVGAREIVVTPDLRR